MSSMLSLRSSTFQRYVVLAAGIAGVFGLVVPSISTTSGALTTRRSGYKQKSVKETLIRLLLTSPTLSLLLEDRPIFACCCYSSSSCRKTLKLWFWVAIRLAKTSQFRFRKECAEEGAPIAVLSGDAVPEDPEVITLDDLERIMKII
uniref:Uncharacterized protein n=1 Tax=Ditylenchus dipsaci TaxID=166011 RepID=A0A915DZB4_9BILA